MPSALSNQRYFHGVKGSACVWRELSSKKGLVERGTVYRARHPLCPLFRPKVLLHVSKNVVNLRVFRGRF